VIVQNISAIMFTFGFVKVIIHSLILTVRRWYFYSQATYLLIDSKKKSLQHELHSCSQLEGFTIQNSLRTVWRRMRDKEFSEVGRRLELRLHLPWLSTASAPEQNRHCPAFSQRGKVQWMHCFGWLANCRSAALLLEGFADQKLSCPDLMHTLPYFRRCWLPRALA
jgi:hypothetical protein